MEALKQDGMALNSASDDLKKDKEVVMVAVNRSGYALEYASETLKADKEVVMAALQENGSALNLLAKRSKQTRKWSWQQWPECSGSKIC